MNKVSLIQICDTTFSESEVDAAKAIVFDAINQRSVPRKGELKKRRCLQDIIKVLKETDPESLPSFVAKDLHRLPPVTFDHVDATALLKDILILKQDVSTIKCDYARESAVSEVCADLAELRIQLKQLQQATQPATGPSLKGIRHKKSKVNSTSKTVNNLKLQVIEKTVSAHDAFLATVPSLQSTSVARTDRELTTVSQEERVLSSTLLGDNFDSTSASNDSYRTVVNKKKHRKQQKRAPNQRGVAKLTSNTIKIAPRLSYIYASRFHENTTEQDITNFISESGYTVQKVEKLSQFKKTSFNSFKITVLQEQEVVFLNNNFWPSGVEYRKYRYRGPTVIS
ncbi:uncharacterized protein LOC126381345 [Pectinophora gossypiella]|uniref:uncharacterized protein LOC126381345 n=1 Tax=Pectinophora gossypiella TaxID=13191 RepID=UPI00214F0B48|nr:uncharacterized protein LOC126381345 [Pectinophora gossypiella]